MSRERERKKMDDLPCALLLLLLSIPPGVQVLDHTSRREKINDKQHTQLVVVLFFSSSSGGGENDRWRPEARARGGASQIK